MYCQEKCGPPGGPEDQFEKYRSVLTPNRVGERPDYIVNCFYAALKRPFQIHTMRQKRYNLLVNVLLSC